MKVSVLLVAFAARAIAFRYSISYGNEESSNAMGVSQRVVRLTEGPMYADGQGGFANGPSEIAVEFTTKNLSASAAPVFFHVVMVDTANIALIGIKSDPDPKSVPTLCCSSLNAARGVCGSGVDGGGIITQSPTKDGVGEAPLIQSYYISSESGPINGRAVRKVSTAGWQYVWLVTCDAVGQSLSIPVLPISVDATFRNPYGYLPGQVGLISARSLYLCMYRD